MKRFGFRLERLLDLRSSAERHQARVLGDALQQEDRARQELEQIATRRAEARRQMEQYGPSHARAGTLLNLVQTVDAFLIQERAAGEVLRDASRRVGIERDRYQEALREKRVLERLRKRARTEWALSVAREEQAASDEVAGRRASRNGLKII